ncbi:hypothetical protein [Jatrophihabitans fulvus]
MSARQRGWFSLSTLLCLAAVIGGAVGAVALVGVGDAATAPHSSRPHTATVVLRPVTADGHAAPGYRAVPDNRPAVECWGTSPVAVDDDIAFCGSSADATIACWAAATPRHVLCLTDPYARTLREIRLTGAFPAARAPKTPSPQGLTLGNGSRFLVRDGGAWGVVKQHPSWVGYFYERGTQAAHLVFGPPKGIGIDRSHRQWTVQVFAQDGRSAGQRRDVVRAYYVGTA